VDSQEEARVTKTRQKQNADPEGERAADRRAEGEGAVGWKDDGRSTEWSGSYFAVPSARGTLDYARRMNRKVAGSVHKGEAESRGNLPQVARDAAQRGTERWEKG